MTDKFKLIILVLLFLTTKKNMSYSQIVSKIEFDNDLDRKEVKIAKKVMKNHELFLILLSKEIPMNFNEDSCRLEIQEDYINKEQIELLNKQKYIVIKFTHRKHCYYGLLPNEFINGKSIKDFNLYKFSVKRMFLKMKIEKRYALHFSYQLNKGTANIPIELISCPIYNGEYDNGLDSYFNQYPPD